MHCRRRRCPPPPPPPPNVATPQQTHSGIPARGVLGAGAASPLPLLRATRVRSRVRHARTLFLSFLLSGFRSLSSFLARSPGLVFL